MIRKYFIFCALLLAPFSLAAQEAADVNNVKADVACCPKISAMTTAIIEVFDGNKFKGIMLIDRCKSPFGKALPSCKVSCQETLEETVKGKAKTFFNIDIYDLRQFHVYSHSSCDFRSYNLEIVHLAKCYSMPTPIFGLPHTHVVTLDSIPWEELSSHHAQILRDYLVYRHDYFTEIMIKP